jgi:hypothetical protein
MDTSADSEIALKQQLEILKQCLSPSGAAGHLPTVIDASRERVSVTVFSWPLPVIPAKAGISLPYHSQEKGDSSFRWNDAWRHRARSARFSGLREPSGGEVPRERDEGLEGC